MDEAREELKRADHLLYVSLKYTRTVDVIKSLIERLLNGLNIAIDRLLKHAKEKKRIKDTPENHGLKCELVRKTYNDEKISDMIRFTMMLRKISKADYKRSNEYRRHVTMTAITDSGIVNITLDVIKEYYDRTTDYIDYVDGMLNPKKE